MTLAPSPTWLMTSTPQAMPHSIVSALMSAEIRWFDCWPEPHCASIVVPATS
jgi:hypothetical protein